MELKVALSYLTANSCRSSKSARHVIQQDARTPNPRQRNVSPSRVSMRCEICQIITEACNTPLADRFRATLGHVQDVLAASCNIHRPLIDSALRDWDCKKWATHELRLNKHCDESYIMFTAVKEFEALINTTPLYELVNGVEGLSLTGRGQVLDQSFVRLDKLKDWCRMCDEMHGTGCKTPPHTQHLNSDPAYLTDVHNHCLVSAPSGSSYFALSYVWGAVQCLNLQQGNLKDLGKRDALRQKAFMVRILKTILHAIELTRLLGTSHLWVDALCIVQDGEDVRQDQLGKMAAIYAGATVTIVAAGGPDASHGLHGICEVSNQLQRYLEQRSMPFGDAVFVQRIFGKESHQRFDLNDYYSRSWTFQEFLSSTRRLVFEKSSVFWDCSCATWFEDIDHSGTARAPRFPDLRDLQEMLSSPLPHLLTLSHIVDLFNSSHLTYDEDCLDAFAGVAAALSLKSADGILCGLPELFFDIAILW